MLIYNKISLNIKHYRARQTTKPNSVKLLRDTPVTPYTRLPISTAIFAISDLQYLQYL